MTILFLIYGSGDRRQKRFGEIPQLGRADAVDRQELYTVTWFALRHVDKRPIGEHRECWNAPFARQIKPQPFQRGQQFGVRRG